MDQGFEFVQFGEGTYLAFSKTSGDNLPLTSLVVGYPPCLDSTMSPVPKEYLTETVNYGILGTHTLTEEQPNNLYPTEASDVRPYCSRNKDPRYTKMSDASISLYDL